MYSTYLMISMWYTQLYFRTLSRYSCDQWIFQSISPVWTIVAGLRVEFSRHGLGDAFVIYQKVLSWMTWKSFVAAFSSFPTARTEKWITSPRRSLETSFFLAYFFSLSLLTFSSIVRLLSQSFCACRFKSVG